MKIKIIITMFLGIGLNAVFAEDVPSYRSSKVHHFRVQCLTQEDYDNRVRHNGNGYSWDWTSVLENAYKVPEAYQNDDGGFVFWGSFNCGVLSEASTPILILNHLAPDSQIQIGSKFLKQIKARQHGTNKFDTEYWYEIPRDVLNISEKGWDENDRNNNIMVWTPEIIKDKKIISTPTLSKIVFENPDVIGKREKARKLQYPYLYPVEEDEDPYVARHW